MSTCPTRDLHSIYLDNEMPDSYKATYEAHVKSCESCQKQLAALKKMQSFFREDADSIQLDKEFLDTSFERLQIKMAYNKNVGRTSKVPAANTVSSENSQKNKIIKYSYFIPAAAAAAAVFAVMLPFSIMSNSSAKKEAEVVPMVATTMTTAEDYALTGSSRGKVISGNITQPVASNNIRRTRQYNSTGSVVGSVVSSNTANANINSNINNDIYNHRNAGRFIRDVDVFLPDFYNEEQSNYIRVVVPGLPEAPTAGQN